MSSHSSRVMTSAKAAPVKRRRIRQGPHPLTLTLSFLVMGLTLVPFAWLLNTSFKVGPALSSPDLIVSNPSFGNYLEVFSNADFGIALRNSLIIAGSVTLLSLIFGSLAAYPLARLPMRRKGLLLTMVLSISTFPVIAVAAPIFDIWSKIGLYNTLPGVIIPKLTFALPLAIFTLTSFFREIPFEIDDSAAIDGATPFQTYRKIILPLAAPGLATTGILVFFSAWNEFLLPVTLTSTPDVRPVPVAIAYFNGLSEFEQPIGTITAASVLITIPLLIVVLVFQRKIVAGLTAGAVKS
ncbi:MAG: carbohydrate ABC transporter permease [Propionicimonas sp.]